MLKNHLGLKYLRAFLIKIVAFWCLILISMTISGSCVVKIDQEIEFHKPALSLIKSSFEQAPLKAALCASWFISFLICRQ